MLGDLVDRGPDSQAVVAKVRELNLECVKGNHEDKMIRWIKHEKVKSTSNTPNPMKSMSSNDAKAAAKMTDEDVSFLKNLPLRIHLGNSFYAVHGGLEPGLEFNKQIPAQVMRVRYVNEKGRGVSLKSDLSQPENTTYWANAWKGSQSIVFGHAVLDMDNPVVFNNENNTCLALDTGCVFGGHLTAAFLHPKNSSYEFEFVKVKAKQVYSKLKGE